MVMISPLGKWESPNELDQFSSGLSKLSDAKLTELGSQLSAMQRDKTVRAVSSRLFPEDVVDRPIPIKVALDLVRQIEVRRTCDRVVQSPDPLQRSHGLRGTISTSEESVALRPLSVVQDRIAQLEDLVSEWSEDAHNSFECAREVEGKVFSIAARMASILRDLSAGEPPFASRMYDLLKSEVLDSARVLCAMEQYSDAFSIPHEIVDAAARKLLAKLGG
jgi:hypothetical protein